MTMSGCWAAGWSVAWEPVGLGDGSIDLWLQRQPPADPVQLANWLPAPPGAMQLTLRAYLPRPALQQGRGELPTIERLG